MKRKTTAVLALLCAMAIGVTGCGKVAGGGSIKNEYIKISQYLGVEIPDSQVAEVTDEEIEMQMQNEVYNYIEREEVTDRAIQAGDLVNVDYVGTIDGVAFDGGTASGAEILVSETDEGYIAGFTTAMIGHNTGDVFDASMKFPEDYGNADVAGKDAVFNYTINGIYVETTPELNDEFVEKNIEGCSTLDEFREMIREELTKTNEETAEEEKKSAAWQKVLDNTEVISYPEDQIQEEITAYKDMYQSYADGYGVTLAEFLETYVGTTEEEFNLEIEEAAQSSVKARLVSEAIAEKEGLTLTDEEYNNELKEMAADYGFEDGDSFLAAYADSISPEQIRNFLLQEKVVNFIAENAVITAAAEADADAAQEDGAGATEEAGAETTEETEEATDAAE